MNVYLKSYLAPFEIWLARDDVTDIWVNRPGEVWIETLRGGTERKEAPEISEVVLERLARQIAGITNQGVNREQPLLSASLPNGARVQVVAPPAARNGLALAVRKHSISNLSLDELRSAGYFERTPERAPAVDDGHLHRLLSSRNYADFLSAAVKARKTIVIAGGTSSGKTTLLNALVKLIDDRERLIAIEDVPELRVEHTNSLSFIAVRGELGEARIGAQDLLEASLRMRPDRILLGELRGKEAFTYLRAVSTGHPGSITTVHADSPDAAVKQITMMALLAGVGADWPTIETYVRQVVDVIVQMKRDSTGRYVDDIRFNRRGETKSADV